MTVEGAYGVWPDGNGEETGDQAQARPAYDDNQVGRMAAADMYTQTEQAVAAILSRMLSYDSYRNQAPYY